MKRPRIALFGGTFDPPHLGHRRVAQRAAEKFRLDEVVWIPARISPFKEDRPPTGSSHRLHMTRLAVEGTERFSVSGIELEREGLSYTVDTLRAFRAERHGCRLFLLMGADSYADFPSWKEPMEIRKLAELIIYPRTEQATEPVENGDHLLEGPLFDVSGSEIRERIRVGKSIADLVPGAVLEYILSTGLYRPPGDDPVYN